MKTFSDFQDLKNQIMTTNVWLDQVSETLETYTILVIYVHVNR